MCVYVCGKGEGVGRVGKVLLCGCVRERKSAYQLISVINVWVCMGLISCIFNLCLN